MSKIVIPFYFNSSNGVVNVMLKRAATALEKLGYDIVDIPQAAYVTESALLLAVGKLLSRESGNTLLLTTAGHLLDKITLTGDHIRNISWLVDHPSYHFNRLNLGDKTSIISANSEHRGFIEDLTPCKYLFDSISCVNSPKENFTKNFSKNPMYDFLVAATWMGEPEKFWLEISDPSLQKLAKTGVDTLLGDELLDPYAIYSELFAEASIQRSRQVDSAIAYLCMQSDLFIRKYSRIKIISSLVSSDCKVLFVGDGWSNILPESHKITIMPTHAFEYFEQMVPLCRYVLNLNAPSGASERVSAAFQGGRPVVSQVSMSMEKLKKGGAGVRMFSLTQEMRDLTFFFGNCLDYYEEDQSKVMDATGVPLWSNLSEQLDSSLWGN